MGNPETAVEESSSAEVGRRLRAARAKAGVTRRQLAISSGASERYLAHIEAGTGNPTISVLRVLADALDVAVADLLPVGGERSERRATAAGLLRRLSETQLSDAIEWLQRPSTFPSYEARRVALVGLRGAGKSSLGLALAARLGVPFVEMSKEVEKAYGGEMRLLIELGGQSALRRYEHEAWEGILHRFDSAIIATPGGIVADAGLFDRVLSTAHCVWLEATPEDHMSRVMAQGDFRPMASNRAAMDDLKEILSARAMDYARADARLNTSSQSFDATLRKLERIVSDLIQA